MYSFSESNDGAAFKISSEMRTVDRAVNDVRIFLTQKGFDRFSDFFVVLRELLINAVEHGNKKNPDKIVSCVIHLIENDRFEITVQDQGNGFDHKRLDYKMPGVRQARLRGYPLIKEFSEKIFFNEIGNKTTVILRYQKDTGFDIREENGWQVIRPNGDITAAVADNFRLLLLELVTNHATRFRFDLQNVKDMDSVALGVFFVLPAALTGKQSELEIVNARQDLRNLFRVTMLDQVYRVN